MSKIEYILSEDWCPNTYNEKSLIKSLEEHYGIPVFKYVFHPPEESNEDVLVLYGAISPNIHIFLSIDTPADHLPYQKFNSSIKLTHFRLKKEYVHNFIMTPLDVINDIKTYTHQK